MAIFKGKKFIMAWPRFEPGTRLATAGDHLSYYATGHAMLDTALISMYIKPRANRRNIVGQQLPTLLDVTASVCTPVACCLKGCCAKFETGQAFSYVQRDASTTPNMLGQQCLELLRPFSKGFRRSCQRLTLKYL